jgi:hypothetical protein
VAKATLYTFAIVFVTGIFAGLLLGMNSAYADDGGSSGGDGRVIVCRQQRVQRWRRRIVIQRRRRIVVGRQWRGWIVREQWRLRVVR